MRVAPVVLSILMTTACTSDPTVGFTLISQLDQPVQRVIVQDDAVASAAMADQICLLDVQGAAVIGDLDAGAGQETLLDAFGDDTLAVLGDTVLRLPRTALDDGVREQWTMSALDGRLLHSGAVLLAAHQGACALHWTAGPEGHWVIPETRCGGPVDMAVERDSGAVWLVDGQSLTRVTPDGSFAQWAGVDANRISRDAVSGHLLLGAAGEDWLQAVDSMGEPVWSRELPGTLRDVAVAGDSEVVTVSLSEDAGGSLQLIDVPTGSPVGEHPLPGPVDLGFSDDGGTMALVHEAGVLFYNVDTDVRPLDPPMTDGAALSASASGLGLAAAIGAGILVATITD